MQDPHFARLGAEMRLPQQKHVFQYPPVRGFNPPAGPGVLKNQVAGVVLTEDQARQRQFQGVGCQFKFEVIQSEQEAAGLCRICFALRESGSLSN